MSRPFPFVRAIFFALLAPCTYAEIGCHSESCEALSDDISLLQGLLEPDLAAKSFSNDGEITQNSPDLILAKMSFGDRKALIAQSVTKPPKAAVKGTKVKLNAAGDLPAFLSAIKFNMMLFFFFVVCFLFFQRWYPKVYAYRWKDGEPGSMPSPGEQGRFVWIRKSWTVRLLRDMKDPGNRENLKSVEETSGLDAAMLLVFMEFALELMIVLGVPLCAAGIPVYAFKGGGFAKADRLSWAGIGNVIFNNTFETSKPMPAADEKNLEGVQWIYWAVSLTVWVVVVWVQWRIFCKQRIFIAHRIHWLGHMQEPRSTTLLVQGIPWEYCSDDKLKHFFENVFDDRREKIIKDAFVIKDTHYLRKLIAAYEAGLEDQRTTSDSKSADDKRIADADLAKRVSEIKNLQGEILQDKEGRYRTTSGFVTFKNRRDAHRALALRLSRDEDTWVWETPPAALDVQYHDFEVGETTANIWQLLGYAAVAGLFFAFMPIVIGISHVSLKIIHAPFVKNILDATGMESTAKGMLQSIGLTIMMSMLPTFLSWIFQIFYTLKAARWAQLQIQTYYFWFLVLFVLLTTSIGADLFSTISHLAQKPFELFTLLAHKMPFATHFYLNYMMLQPVTHAMNLTRYMNLIKYRTLRSTYFRHDQENIRVKELSEPEDQDYYGMGSRNARMTLWLIMGLVYGTICPLMHVVVFWNFLCARTIYGYLIPFVENRKPDMGGAHWYKSLLHLQVGVLIYIVLMTGVLLERAESKFPGAICAVSFLWWFLSFRKFSHALHWETLTYAEVVEHEKKAVNNAKKPNEDTSKYEQLDLKWQPSNTPGSFAGVLRSEARGFSSGVRYNLNSLRRF